LHRFIWAKCPFNTPANIRENNENSKNQCAQRRYSAQWFCLNAAWSADSETVVIGLAGPLTGPSARIGKDLENGAQLAIDDINKQHPTIGGKAVTFKLQSEDDQSDPRTAVAVAQRLVDSGVAGVVGHWNTGTSIPAARVYHDAGIARLRRSPPVTPIPNRASTPASA
jgi:ABC-type branched-subunit amino acid transport system substrate-binding protein